MRKMVRSEISQHTMKLQQMGAKVKVINSTLCYVRFDLSGFIIQYVYNINSKGHYFLERIKPYPKVMEEIEEEKDIIKAIKVDVEKFKNALNCHHISDFINMARRINDTLENFETTFLNYNVPGDSVAAMHENLEALNTTMDQVRQEAQQIDLKIDEEFE